MVALSTPRVVPHIGLSLDPYVPNRDVLETECSSFAYFWEAKNRLCEQLKFNNVTCV